MAKDSTLGVILALVLIVATLLGIFGYKSIPELFNGMTDSEDSIPFVVNLSPEYFNEGNYEYNNKIPFSIEVFQKNGRNITYLELSKDNFKVSRKDDGLNKPTSNVNWKDYQSDIILSFDYSYPYSRTFPSSLKSEGEMALCNNCFIGDTYPYIFTFTIYYKENESELKSETFNEIIPVK